LFENILSVRSGVEISMIKEIQNKFSIGEGGVNKEKISTQLKDLIELYEVAKNDELMSNVVYGMIR